MSHATDGEAADVLVVGGGPVGLATALLLSQWDLAVTVVERRETRSLAPKAHVVNPRTLEILASAGLDIGEMRKRATSSDDDRVSRFVSRLTQHEFGAVPFEEHDHTFTPHPRMNLMQPELEDILHEHLAQLPGVQVRRGVTWTASTSDQDGVTSTLRASTGDTTIRSSYVVAADGANSQVRDSLGIGMHGLAGVESCLAVTIRADWRELVADRPAMFYWALQARVPGVFLAYDIDGMWSYFILGISEVPSKDECREIILDAVGAPAEFQIELISPWEMTAQVADRYRSGRFFLAGDAAHRFPPTGGLGLNTGVQDVHNLAWKIAAVEGGWARPSLLDTYESERLPVGEINTAQSLQNADAVLDVLKLPEDADQATVDAAVETTYDAFNSLGMQLGFSYGADPAPVSVRTFTPTARRGDRMPHAWIGEGYARMSTLDLLSSTTYSLLTFQPDSWPADDTMSHVTVTGLAGRAVPQDWASLVGLSARAALLVRPDGHIVGPVRDGDTKALQAMLLGPSSSAQVVNPA